MTGQWSTATRCVRSVMTVLMICFHRRYNLGDKHEFTSPNDLQDYLENHGNYNLNKTKFVVLPLYLYDHSILAMSTKSFVGRAHHAEWDSGQIGIIYATHEDIRKWYEIKKVTEKIIEQVKEQLRLEVDDYDRYLRNEDDESEDEGGEDNE
jgi:hypothetical protein